MALLREVLGAYCGYRPFQNYAGQRSQYVGQREKGELGYGCLCLTHTVCAVWLWCWGFWHRVCSAAAPVSPQYKALP